MGRIQSEEGKVTVHVGDSPGLIPLEKESLMVEGIDTIAGKWHLLDIAADEQNIPLHRVDLVFYAAENGFRGAVVDRVNRSEFPLATLQFDGSALKLQMQVDTPMLVMYPLSERFEGYWMTEGLRNLKLKLVRATSSVE